MGTIKGWNDSFAGLASQIEAAQKAFELPDSLRATMEAAAQFSDQMKSIAAVYESPMLKLAETIAESPMMKMSMELAEACRTHPYLDEMAKYGEQMKSIAATYESPLMNLTREFANSHLAEDVLKASKLATDQIAQLSLIPDGLMDSLKIDPMFERSALHSAVADAVAAKASGAFVEQDPFPMIERFEPPRIHREPPRTITVEVKFCCMRCGCDLPVSSATIEALPGESRVSARFRALPLCGECLSGFDGTAAYLKPIVPPPTAIKGEGQGDGVPRGALKLVKKDPPSGDDID